MLSLNPSGFAISFNESCLENLSSENGGKKQFGNARQRRGRFYNVLACMNYDSPIKSFWTFTVKEIQTDYQNSDKFYSEQFQKLLKGLGLRYKRKNTNGMENFVWVCEAQERGNIHFHLVTSTKFIEVLFVQNYWNKLIAQESKNSVDVEFVKDSSVRNISGYFAKYMGKSRGNLGQQKGLKDRVIFCKSYGYSRNFKVFDKMIIHPTRLQKFFPDMEEKKLTKKINDEVSIDYYYLDTNKVIEVIENHSDLLGEKKEKKKKLDLRSLGTKKLVTVEIEQGSDLIEIEENHKDFLQKKKEKKKDLPFLPFRPDREVLNKTESLLGFI